ncbi:MAG: HD-GYP domain-containing protein [Paenisporosarcina sp.]
MKNILKAAWIAFSIYIVAFLTIMHVFEIKIIKNSYLILSVILIGLLTYTIIYRFFKIETQRYLFGLIITIIVALIYYISPAVGFSIFFIPPIFGMLFKNRFHFIYIYLGTIISYLFVIWIHPYMKFEIVNIISELILFLAFLLLLHYATVMITNYEKRKSLYTKTMKALIFAVEAKDPYTEGHSIRVSNYSILLAKRLNNHGFNIDIESLRVASLLHDIGKIDIPIEILRKEGSLTEEEYTIIKTHPTLGYNIAKEMEFPLEIMEAIHYHHERMDGKGYPLQLQGEDIPLYAKIISISDSFDALTSTRSYRSAFSPAKAMKIMIENEGTQFDLKLLKHFIDIIPSITIKEDMIRTETKVL